MSTKDVTSAVVPLLLLPVPGILEGFCSDGVLGLELTSVRNVLITESWNFATALCSLTIYVTLELNSNETFLCPRNEE
jgi:hypothetical protein